MSNSIWPGGKRHITYYHNPQVGNFHYGAHHPMKPHRLALTHSLIMNYGLLDKMDVHIPKAATDEELEQFHTRDYLQFLKAVTPDTPFEEREEFAIQGDCPGFPSVYEFCQLYTGGSIEGAWRLNQKRTDIAINWAGGLHHARKSEGSGFCYVNDIVLAIIELLRYHPRVLYIDIDVHHGDGVQDAFYHTDRVMTVSLHKYATNFFPGTGSVNELGYKDGKYYSVNVPLKDGIDDRSYLNIFKPVISDVMDFYRPTAVVLQCGADSLKGDRIGNFNLTLNGHAECVKFVASYNLPTLVLGGGGYSIRNVSRCWTNETAVLLDVELPFDIPDNDYFAHYGPDFKLQNNGIEVENLNSRNYLDSLLTQVRKNIRTLQHAPSVQMTAIPPSIYDLMLEDSDSDDDHEGGALYNKELNDQLDVSGGLQDSKESILLRASTASANDDRSSSILMDEDSRDSRGSNMDSTMNGNNPIIHNSEISSSRENTMCSLQDPENSNQDEITPRLPKSVDSMDPDIVLQPSSKSSAEEPSRNEDRMNDQ